MIRYFCDRCDMEVEGQQDLLAFASEVGDGVTSSAWRIRRELCPKCIEEAKDLVTKFFGKSTTTTKRRTA